MSNENKLMERKNQSNERYGGFGTQNERNDKTN